MNQEGMEDRYYFSDWGACICTEDEIDEECELAEQHHREDEEED